MMTFVQGFAGPWSLEGVLTFISISVTIHSVSAFESQAIAVRWQVPHYSLFGITERP